MCGGTFRQDQEDRARPYSCRLLQLYLAEIKRNDIAFRYVHMTLSRPSQKTRSSSLRLVLLQWTTIMVSQALKFIHGDHNVSSMKLSLEEKKKVFKIQDDSITEMVYNNLVDQNVSCHSSCTSSISIWWSRINIHSQTSICSICVHTRKKEECCHPLQQLGR